MAPRRSHSVSMMGGSGVFVGVWHNYSKNLILGSTITLEESRGDILQSILALLVQSAGQSFWAIISYIIHQARNNRPSDHPIFYQQQGVLRNSGSALTAALRLGQLSFNWRARSGIVATRCRFKSTLYYIFVALMVSVGFTLASIFSSRVTKFAGNEVLLLPNECGYWASRNFTIHRNAKRALLTDAWSAMYANTCYKDDSNLLCHTFIKQNIPSEDDKRKTPCPFPEDICADDAWSRDTGYKNTATILGVNAKPSNQLFFRKKATCAPLNLSKYRENYIKTFQEGGEHSLFVKETVLQFYLGPQGKDPMRNNNTSKRSKDLSFEYHLATGFGSPGYRLQALYAEVGKEKAKSTDWQPIRDFRRPDADTVIFLLSTSGVAYKNSISDPFFRAESSSRRNNISFDGESQMKVFRPKEEDSVTGIGCIDQYQICNPSFPNGPRRCTSLTSVRNVAKMIDELDLNPIQNATANILYNHLAESGIYKTVRSQGEAALKARATSYSIQNDVVQVGNETELSWKKEVDYWFSASLASLQINFVKTVGDGSKKDRKSNNDRPPLFQFRKQDKNQQNQDDAERQEERMAREQNFIKLDKTPSERAICSNQMVQIMDGYQNFSLLGVLLILIFSILLIALSFYIHVVGAKIQQILFGNSLARVSWTSDGYLQIQRMAYEGAGYEGWQQCATDDVPISRDIEKLGGLDISDFNHPRLLRATDISKETYTRERRPQNQDHRVPSLPDFSTLPAYSKELPLSPMLLINLSSTVLGTSETNSADQE